MECSVPDILVACLTLLIARYGPVVLEQFEKTVKRRAQGRRRRRG